MLSKTLPVSVSSKLLEEHNNSNKSSFSSSPHSYQSYSSRSISPEPTFDSILSGHSLHRKPTFSYIPIDTRRRSMIFLRSTPLNTISTSVPSQLSTHSATSTTTNLSSTPESEVPTTPTSLCSLSSDQSVEYTSFPNLEKFADECWTEVRVEKKDDEDDICDIEMEPYDEMFVAGVCFQYS